MIHSFATSRPRTGIGRMVTLGVMVALVPCQAAPAAAEATRQQFAIPEGTAIQSIRRVARESGANIVVDPQAARGVRTPPLNGEFTPREALERMLEDTPLIVLQDEQTLSFAIKRRADDQPIPVLEEAPSSNEPTADSKMNGLRKLIDQIKRAAAAATITAGASGAAAQEETDTVVLSPFTVETSRDTGYVASETLAGSRLSTKIANTPIALSVLTKEFLQDIGAIDGREAIEYALNGTNDTTGGTANGLYLNSFSYQVRGIINATSTRNFFQSGVLNDNFNTERLEIARGPNAILFGTGNPGGVYNSSTKRARIGADQNSISLRVGSYSEFRATADFSKTLIDEVLAVRINLLKQNKGGFYDFERDDREAFAGSLTFRPFKNTTIRAEAEIGSFFAARARPFGVGNGFEAWQDAGGNLNNYGQSAPNTATLGNGIWVAPQSPYGVAPVALSAFRRSTNPNLPGVGRPADIRDESIAPETANFMGPGSGRDTDHKVYGVFLEQKLAPELYVELAGYWQEVDDFILRPAEFPDAVMYIDTNATIPVYGADGTQTGTQPNPNAGQYVMTHEYRDHTRPGSQSDVRLTMNYNLDLGRFGFHRMTGLLSRNKGEQESYQRRENNVAESRPVRDVLNIQNRVRRLTYLDFSRPETIWRGPQDPRLYPVSGRLLGTDRDIETRYVAFNWTRSETTNDSAMFAVQSSFWDERIWTTLGYRRDSVERFQQVPLRDPDTNELLRPELDTTPAFDLDDDTYSAGIVGHVNSWLSVFANWSENFNPQSNQQFFGDEGSRQQLGNILGEGSDMGIRAQLFGGKANVSLAYYTTDNANQVFFIEGAVTTGVNAIWEALGENRNTGGNSNRAAESDGFEFEVTANPLPNLRLTANLSYSDRRETQSYAPVLDYIEANRSIWLSPTNAGKPVAGTPLGTTVAEVVDAIVNEVIPNDLSTSGNAPFENRDVKANFFGRYAFTDGALKGFAVGLGANYRGPMTLGYTAEGEELTGYKQIFVNGMVSYQTRVFEIPARFQLNVDNMLGFDDGFPRQYAWNDDTDTASIVYRYPNYRRWSLTATFDF